MLLRCPTLQRVNLSPPSKARARVASAAGNVAGNAWRCTAESTGLGLQWMQVSVLGCSQPIISQHDRKSQNHLIKPLSHPRPVHRRSWPSAGSIALSAPAYCAKLAQWLICNIRVTRIGRVFRIVIRLDYCLSVN